MKKSIALLLCSGAVCCSAAIQPAVAFRFDDNHNIRIWDTLSDVFRRNNVRFSCSIIPYWSNDLNKADWCKKICQLESEGFEIMDHTPNHNTSAITLPEGDPRWGTLKDAPFVDHINGRKVCLKYSVGNSTFSKPFTIKIFDKNRVLNYYEQYIKCSNEERKQKAMNIIMIEINKLKQELLEPKNIVYEPETVRE